MPRVGVTSVVVARGVMTVHLCRLFVHCWNSVLEISSMSHRLAPRTFDFDLWWGASLLLMMLDSMWSGSMWVLLHYFFGHCCRLQS